MLGSNRLWFAGSTGCWFFRFPAGYVVELSKLQKSELVENFHRFIKLKHSTVNPKAFPDPHPDQTCMQSLETLSGLTTGQIDIWFCNVDHSAKEVREFAAVLSPEETARAQRFRFLHDRNRYIAQHGVLRSLLCDYVGCGPRQVDIRSSADGKPYLDGPERGAIHFSASQSDAFAAFAFSRIGSIGVDIEKMREIPDLAEIVERHFTPREKHAIFSVPESLCSGLFYKLWTRKEAVLKAQGEGLLRPLDCVDVAASVDASRPWKVLVRDGPVAEDFWVMDVNGPEGFAAAVASAGPFDEILIRWR